MPLSVWLLTFFIIAMILVWIADGGIRRLSELKKDKILILLFCGIYFVHIIWMLNTSDLSFGLRELKMKLPLLIFPLVIGLSEPLDKSETKIVLSFLLPGLCCHPSLGLLRIHLEKIHIQLMIQGKFLCSYHISGWH